MCLYSFTPLRVQRKAEIGCVCHHKSECACVIIRRSAWKGVCWYSFTPLGAAHSGDGEKRDFRGSRVVSESSSSQFRV
jgi:hypothetical protein